MRAIAYTHAGLPIERKKKAGSAVLAFVAFKYKNLQSKQVDSF